MADFVTNDSGKRVDFGTGSVRDTNEGKPRFDLIWVGFLYRLAMLMMRGAVKYGENNWMKGQKVSRYYESALRHLYQWKEGDRTEDHLAAVAFNIMGIMYTYTMVKNGWLPNDLIKDNEGVWYNCADSPIHDEPEKPEETSYYRRNSDLLRNVILKIENGSDMSADDVVTWSTSFKRDEILIMIDHLMVDKVLADVKHNAPLRYVDLHTGEILRRLSYKKNLCYKELRDWSLTNHIVGGLEKQFNGAQFLDAIGHLDALGVVVVKDEVYNL